MALADKFPHSFNVYQGNEPAAAGQPSKPRVVGKKLPSFVQFLEVAVGQFGFVLSEGNAATLANDIDEYLKIRPADKAAARQVPAPVPPKPPVAAVPPAPTTPMEGDDK